MMHIIVGLFFIALGIWGVFDEWYYVIDFIKGGFSVFLLIAGIIGILAGVTGPAKKPDKNEGEAEPYEDLQAEEKEPYEQA